MPLNPPVRDWRGRSVWLVGASSGIGRATAAALHARGAVVTVSARNADALAAFVATRPGAVALPLDVTDAAALNAAAADIAAGPAGLQQVVFCAGYYAPQRADSFSLDEMLRHQQVNYVGALNTLHAALPHLMRQGAGAHLSLVSSVAGFRGLPRSLGYGPTKAALINLAESLYLDLHDRGVGVSVVNPGFVETPLTAVNDFHMPAMITPDEAAREIIAGWEGGDFAIEFPKRFTRWLRLMRLLPYRPYFRLTRRFTGL